MKGIGTVFNKETWTVEFSHEVAFYNYTTYLWSSISIHSQNLSIYLFTTNIFIETIIIIFVLLYLLWVLCYPPQHKRVSEDLFKNVSMLTLYKYSARDYIFYYLPSTAPSIHALYAIVCFTTKQRRENTIVQTSIFKCSVSA